MKSSRQQVSFPYVQSKVRIYKPFLIALLALCAFTASAQTYAWDNTGNGLLKGTYYFRQVVWLIDTSGSGELGEALAIYGTINFDGNGNYSTAAQIFDTNSNPAVQNYNVSGTYSIGASGYGFINDLLEQGDAIYGLVANGIFIGSSTENQVGYNDLMIAAPLASPAPTAASLRGNYTLVGVDVPYTGMPTEARDMLITFSADGNGNLTGVNASGYMGYAPGTPIRQNLGSLKYIASNGGFNLHFGGSFSISNVDTTMITGDHYLYMSPDGSFIFGGSPTGWDMLVGVQNAAPTSNFSGLYYQAGLDQDVTFLAQQGFSNIENYFGSFKAIGNNTVFGHQRFFSTANFTASSTGVIDFTYHDSTTSNPDGTINDSYYHEYFTGNGAVRIGVGLPPRLGINVALRGPTFSSSSSAPFLDPTGIVNNASNALFTTSITVGELVTIYGANIANGTARDATFPTTLNGVQVQVNGVAAPILSVNDCSGYPCVTFMVPYETSGTIAQIQLFNNGVGSNIVTAWVSIVVDANNNVTAGTAPGVFTIPATGLGYAAAQHTTDFSTVTPDNPARPGEIIAVYLTGIGPVNPAVASGAPGPVPLANAVSNISVFIGGSQAATSFVGLTPGAIGLAQINLTIPTGLAAGDYTLELLGPDSDTFEALISIGSGSTAGREVSHVRHSRSKPPTGLNRSLKPRM